MAELPTFAQGNMPSFTPPAEDRDSASSLLRGALGDQFSGIGNLMDRKAKADEEAMRLEQQQKQTELEKKAGAYKTYAEGIKGQYEQAKPTLMAPAPKFNVTKDTEEGLTGLAALMTIGGMIIGSKGSTSGINAMNAMTGVLKGYQEGNQQRIDFETKKYEQSIKDWERSLQQTKDALSRYEKMASLDLNRATAEAAAYAASQGQDVIAAKIRSGTIGDALKMVDKLQQQTASAKTQWATINGQTGLYSQAEIRAAQEAGVPITQAAKTGGTTPAPIKIMKDGKTVYADRNGNPILDKEGQPIAAPDTRTASAETRYSFNVAESMGQAIQDLKNVQLLPKDSVLGTFAGLTGADAKGIVNGLRNVFARRVTDEDNRLFEQMIGGLETNMARALGGGYASSTTAKNIEAYRSQVAREGDSPVAKAIFLARMRQELDTLADFYEQRPGAAPFVPVVKKYQQLLHESVPFTVDDVIKARSNIGNLPIGAEGASQRAGGTAGAAPMKPGEYRYNPETDEMEPM